MYIYIYIHIDVYMYIYIYKHTHADMLYCRHLGNCEGSAVRTLDHSPNLARPGASDEVQHEARDSPWMPWILETDSDGKSTTEYV
jgi:hypothetical protein